MLKSIFVVLALVLSVYVLGWGFFLMRLPSDLAVLGGMLLIIFGGFLTLKSLQTVLKMIGIGVLAFTLTGCAERIDPGYVGIVVNYYGDAKGPDDIPVVSGMNWYNPMTTAILEYPTFVQTVQWTQAKTEQSPGNEEVVFNDKDGLSIAVDISLSYQVTDTKVPAFYVKFRTEDMEKFTHGFMRNVARDAFNELGVQYTAEQVYGGQKEQFLTAVRDRVNKEVAEFGVTIQQFGVIGGMRLPPNVVEALNNKIKATQDAQRIENELRSATAEAQKLVAEAEGYSRVQKLRGEADASYNRLLAESLTPLLVQNRAISAWDGKLPSTSLGSQTPIIFGGVK